MELTQRHKVLLVVAGLGLAAVGVDRLVLGSGSAGVDSQEEQASEGQRTSSGVVRVVMHNPAAKLAGERLSSLEAELDVKTMRDVFVPPQVWMPAATTGGQPVVARASDPRIEQARRLAQALKLSAVVLKPQGTAVVNGQLLRVGKPASVRVGEGDERMVTLLSVEGSDREAGIAGRAMVQVGEVRIALQIAQSGASQAAPSE